MRHVLSLLLLVLVAVVNAPARAQTAPLEVSVARAGGKPIPLDVAAMTGEEVQRISLGDLTRGRPPDQRLPSDAELALQTMTAGERLSVTVAVYRADATGERRAGREGASVTSALATAKRSTHRTVELAPGETRELVLDGLVVTLRRPSP
jgi:hypothetical protein